MRKEECEWIQSFCDHADRDDLPRILLIGDSITGGYQAILREKMRGIAYVDYIATSYAIDTPIFNTLIKTFAKDSKYALIHFNHGLHGIHMTPKTYESRMRKLTADLCKLTKVALVESTCVMKEGNKRPHTKWTKRVTERNAAVAKIAGEMSLPVDKLHAVSLDLPTEKRYIDGIHYTPAGYETLAEAAFEFIKAQI